MSSTPLLRRSVTMNSAMFPPRRVPAPGSSEAWGPCPTLGRRAGTLRERLRQQRVGGGVRIDLPGLDGGGRLVEALPGADRAGPLVEPLHHDGPQLVADALGATGGQPAIGLQEGPVGADGFPQLLQALAPGGDG